jgi:peroxiredoxin
MAILPDFAIFVTEHTFEMKRLFLTLSLAALLLPSCRQTPGNPPTGTPEEEALDSQYAATLLQSGTKVPDFTLNDLSGQAVRLSDFRGKTVILVFWASWCPDCRAEIPLLKEMAAAADPQKVQFVSVSFDRDFDTLCQFVKDNDLPGVQLFDPAGKQDSAVGADFGVKWIPSLYVINPKGKVALATVVAGKVASVLTGRSLPGALLPKNLCTDESCELP